MSVTKVCSLRVFIILAISLVMFRAVESAETPDYAQQVAQKSVAALTAAFHAHDGRAFAAEFWPDAEFMNVFGQVVTGQEQIEKLHDTVFKGALKDRVVHMEIRGVRQLGPNVIVVDTTDSNAAKPGDRVTRMKLILEKRQDTWRVVAGQNTGISTPAFATGAPQ
jgi:uncharacterized protein (TIGR02246 family)